jgi:hypothetical protein
MAAKELTAAQRQAKRELGKLERRIARTTQTQAQRREVVAKLKAKINA